MDEEIYKRYRDINRFKVSVTWPEIQDIMIIDEFEIPSKYAELTVDQALKLSAGLLVAAIQAQQMIDEYAESFREDHGTENFNL